MVSVNTKQHKISLMLFLSVPVTLACTLSHGGTEYTTDKPLFGVLDVLDARDGIM